MSPCTAVSSSIDEPLIVGFALEPSASVGAGATLARRTDRYWPFVFVLNVSNFKD